MGEDVADIPPAGWQSMLDDEIEKLESAPSHLIVDLSEMFWLVGQDWGYLLRLAERLESIDSRLTIIASNRVAESAKVTQLDVRIRICDSMDAASADT
jgi:hypothetical protein